MKSIKKILIVTFFVLAFALALTSCTGKKRPAEQTSDSGTVKDVYFSVTLSVEGYEPAEVYVKEGESLAEYDIPAFEREGYELTFEKDGLAYDMTSAVTEDISLTGVWIYVNAEYTVKVFEEGLDGEYAEAEAGYNFGTLSAKIGSTVNIAEKAEEQTKNGFELTENGVLEGEVKQDGSLVLTVYYARKSYTVTFVDENGETIQSGVLKFGATPECAEEIPLKASTENYSYEFSGWTPSISEVTADVTYKTVYREIAKLTVTFEVTDYEGTIPSQKVEYGKVAIEPETPVRSGYAFVGWDYDFTALVTSDITIKGAMQQVAVVRYVTVEVGTEVDITTLFKTPNVGTFELDEEVLQNPVYTPDTVGEHTITQTVGEEEYTMTLQTVAVGNLYENAYGKRKTLVNGGFDLVDSNGKKTLYGVNGNNVLEPIEFEGRYAVYFKANMASTWDNRIELDFTTKQAAAKYLYFKVYVKTLPEGKAVSSFGNSGGANVTYQIKNGNSYSNIDVNSITAGNWYDYRAELKGANVFRLYLTGNASGYEFYLTDFTFEYSDTPVVTKFMSAKGSAINIASAYQLNPYKFTNYTFNDNTTAIADPTSFVPSETGTYTINYASSTGNVVLTLDVIDGKMLDNGVAKYGTQNGYSYSTFDGSYVLKGVGKGAIWGSHYELKKDIFDSASGALTTYSTLKFEAYWGGTAISFQPYIEALKGVTYVTTNAQGGVVQRSELTTGQWYTFTLTLANATPDSTRYLYFLQNTSDLVYIKNMRLEY